MEHQALAQVFTQDWVDLVNQKVYSYLDDYQNGSSKGLLFQMAEGFLQSGG